MWPTCQANAWLSALGAKASRGKLGQRFGRAGEQGRGWEVAPPAEWVAGARRELPSAVELSCRRTVEASARPWSQRVLGKPILPFYLKKEEFGACFGYAVVSLASVLVLVEHLCQCECVRACALQNIRHELFSQKRELESFKHSVKCEMRSEACQPKRKNRTRALWLTIGNGIKDAASLGCGMHFGNAVCDSLAIPLCFQQGPESSLLPTLLLSFAFSLSLLLSEPLAACRVSISLENRNKSRQRTRGLWVALLRLPVDATYSGACPWLGFTVVVS